MNLSNTLMQGTKVSQINIKPYLLFLLVNVLILYSCNKSISIEELKSYVHDKDNGFVKSETINNIEYAVLYSPPQYEAIKRLGGNTELNEQLVKESINSFDDHFIFYTSFRDIYDDDLLKKQGDNNLYEKKIMYLIGEIQNDFSLVNGIDTINCVLHHFERGYGLNKSVNITLLFPKPANYNDLTFIYEDKLFNAGKLKYRFDKTKISQQFDIKYY